MKNCLKDYVCLTSNSLHISMTGLQFDHRNKDVPVSAHAIEDDKSTEDCEVNEI